jgi:class 3 adenylate cyclase
MAMGRTQAVTILFCDLVASTERRARLGDDAFDQFTTRFMATLRSTIAEADGRVVSSAGDGLMVVFPASIADAVACATTMHRAVGELDPHDPPLLRVGISSGEVAQDGDEYSGMPIVEAARLEAAACSSGGHRVSTTSVGGSLPTQRDTSMPSPASARALPSTSSRAHPDACRRRSSARPTDAGFGLVSSTDGEAVNGREVLLERSP